MNIYQPRSVLVTGGAGFIGSHFINYLLSHDEVCTVVNLDKLTYAGSLNHLKGLTGNKRYHFIQGDIADEKLIRHLLLHHRIDTIIHFAAESHVDRSINEPAAFIQTNIVGTFHLLEAARHYWINTEKADLSERRFHHISTDEVFGSLAPDEALFNETTAYQPRSPYAASKASSDHLVNAYYHTYGLPVTLSNCSNNYGPHQHAEKFIPTVIRACLNGQPIPLYGTGKNIRDWLYVEDHCRGILLVLKQGKTGNRYMMGGNNEWENLALATFICEEMDKRKPQKIAYKNLLNFVTDRSGHDFRYAIDSTKMERELGWRPQETLKTGIIKTLDYYLAHQ